MTLTCDATVTLVCEVGCNLKLDSWFVKLACDVTVSYIGDVNVLTECGVDTYRYKVRKRERERVIRNC